MHFVVVVVVGQDILMDSNAKRLLADYSLLPCRALLEKHFLTAEQRAISCCTKLE